MKGTLQGEWHRERHRQSPGVRDGHLGTGEGQAVTPRHSPDKHMHRRDAHGTLSHTHTHTETHRHVHTFLSLNRPLGHFPDPPPPPRLGCSLWTPLGPKSPATRLEM